MFVALLLLLPSLVAQTILSLVFSPAAALMFWQEAPLSVAVSPLLSNLAQAGLFAAAFDCIFLLVAGRHVEKALGGVGLTVTFVAGCYGGALARLLLTPGSAAPGIAASGAMFAVVGAYLVLYGIPRGLPIAPGGSRLKQIAVLAGVWALLQFAFLFATGGADFSIAIVEPLGGLAAGVALARPLLGWRYRRA